jgi:hypothetical protein
MRDAVFTMQLLTLLISCETDLLLFSSISLFHYICKQNIGVRYDMTGKHISYFLYGIPRKSFYFRFHPRLSWKHVSDSLCLELSTVSCICLSASRHSIVDSKLVFVLSV